MTLGERLKDCRKKKKWTQLDVANKLELNHTTISKWESDTYEPDADSLGKLAELYGVSVDYLLGRKPNDKSEGYFAFSDGGENWTEEEFEYAKAAVEALRKLRGKDKK